MENNNYQNPSAQIYQNNNEEYMAKANEFLKKAIISCAISFIPVASVIAMCMASKNRKQLLEYLDRGGLHTIRIKFASALSRAGKYSGLAYTIFWVFYAILIGCSLAGIIFAAVSAANNR